MTKKRVSTLVFEVTDDGSLKLFEGNTKKATKAVDKLSKSEQTLNRNFKGASQQSSNTTKNFSKMAQGITGGLVPAYATLAANVFAIGAAFRFLQDAANYRILIEGQREYATITGESLKLLTSRLQAATGQQLAFAEAAQSVAIARAAGLTSNQIERLGTLAKNASIALGRDLTDSLNRLIRGTTKAEPELLDELGIILRLEIATQKYADSINKTKDSLTIFEKSQAVVNEVLSQGEEKFGEFNTSLNEFTVLAKSFDDLINDIKSGLTGVAEFIARGLTQNIYALTGAFALLGSGILRAITPQVPDIDVAAGAAGAREASLGLLNKAGRKKFGNLETDAQLNQFERSMNAQNTKFSAVERSKRQEVAKTTSVIRAHNALLVADSGTTYAKMSARFKIELYTMEAAYGKVLGRMKLAALYFSRAITAIGWIGLLVSAVSILAQFSEKFKSVETKQFEQQMEAITNKLQEQNKELRNLTANLKDTSTYFAKLMQTSKFFQNFDFTGVGAAFGTVGQASIASARGVDTRFLRSGAITILEETVSSLEMMQTKLKPSSEAFKELEEKIVLFREGIEKGRRGTLVADEIKAISNELVDLDENGTKAAKGIAKFSAATNIMANSVQEFQRALSKLRVPSGSLSTIATAMQNFGSAVGDVGGAQEILKDYKIQNTKSASGKAFEKLIDDATGGALKTFIGAEKFEEIMASYIPSTRGFMGSTKKGNEEETLVRLGNAAKAKAKEIFDMEQRHMTSKITLQTQLLNDSYGMTKLVTAQLQKEAKITDLETERANKLEYIAQLKSLSLTQNDAEVAKEEANIKNLEAKLKLAQREADLLMQVGDTFRNSFEQGMATAFQAIIEGTKSVKEAFGEMTKMILQSLAQILAQQAAMTIMSMLPAGFGVFPGGRYGGVMNPPGYRSFAGGGIGDGPDSGYTATLHGTEAVVPLGNDRAIPVKFENGGQGGGNVTVNVNMTTGETTTTGEDAYTTGRAIAQAVQNEIARQQRPGGSLSPY